MSSTLEIRQARVDEAPLLTELTVRSKCYWGYDASFLADARKELEFLPNKFEPDFHVYVLQECGQIMGFCSLIPRNHEAIELHDLFIEPEHIGKGYGKLLWEYSVKLARELGFARLFLTADPNAEPFYERQGAVRISENESPVRSGRKLPVMEYLLAS